MRVLIVGAGKMGTWLASRLRAFHQVYLSDLPGREVPGFEVLHSPDYTSFDAVIVSASLSAIPSVIKDVEASGFRGILSEIGSVKWHSYELLRAHSGRVASVHPLFGPGQERLEGSDFILVSVRDMAKELGAAQELYPGARMTPMGLEEHEEFVARTIQLNHMLSIMFNRLRARGGPSPGGVRLMELVEAQSLYGSEGLIGEMASLNPKFREVLEDAKRIIEELEAGRPSFVRDERHAENYRLAYSVLRLLGSSQTP